MMRKPNYKKAFIIMLIAALILIVASLILKSQLKKSSSLPSPSPTATTTTNVSISAQASATATVASDGAYTDSENKFTFQVLDGYSETKTVEDFINPANEARQTIISKASKKEIDEFIKNGDKTVLFSPSEVLYIYVSKVDDQVTETLMKNSKSNAPLTTKNNLNATKFTGLTNSGYTYDQVVVDIGLGQNKMLIINNYYQGDASAQDALNKLLDTLKKT